LWINFIWFQLVWLIAVYFTEDAQYFLVLSLLAHFYLTPTCRHDFWVMFSVTLLGASADALLKLAGVMAFMDTAILPVWLLILWAHFALALNHSLSWLKRFPGYLQAVFGGIFGPLSYYAGYKMGAVLFPLQIPRTLLILAVIWFCLLPVYVVSTRYFKGNRYAKKYSS
ncbi:MAG: DUF2878 domain-containing protein, partial [Psychromonas sp.]|nr:DUF2878 domain-containing protein [Psychromonas sp.]